MYTSTYSRLSDEELDRIVELSASGVFRAVLAKRKRMERKARQRRKVKLDTNNALLAELLFRMTILTGTPKTRGPSLLYGW